MREGVFADLAILGRPFAAECVAVEWQRRAIGRDRTEQCVGALLTQGVEILDRTFTRSPEPELFSRKIDVAMLEKLFQSASVLYLADRMAERLGQVPELLGVDDAKAREPIKKHQIAVSDLRASGDAIAGAWPVEPVVSSSLEFGWLLFL